ncbi:MAG: LPS export ABC transporter permease LptF [Rhodospirillaceae bacterium]|jgi:lipopolysaccharide export system permease protein|nr:LPS export ABC transporter permease LptF [Rhodospirillaceae bacterium]
MGISRYVLGQLATAMIFVVVTLTLVIWLSQSLRFIDLIVNRGLPLATFLYLTVLLMPTWLSIALPIGCFASVLYIYNRMINDREIVVLTAAGISPLGLARPAFYLALGSTVLSYAMTLYLMPVSYRAFKELQFSIRHNYSDLLLREGVFNAIGPGVTVYVRERKQSGELTGIIVHDERDPKVAVTLMAERGALVMNDRSPRVFMRAGNRQSRNAETGHTDLLYFDRYTIDLGVLGNEARRTFREQNELFVTDLLNPTAKVTDPRNAPEFVAEGHFRLASPLLSPALTLIVLVVLLRGEFSRRGQGRRVALAILLVAATQSLLLAAKYLGAKQPLLIGSMYIVLVIPMIICTFLLFRQKFRRQDKAEEKAEITDRTGAVTG